MLQDGYSYATFAQNVHELSKTLPHVQAIAAAYAHARVCYFRAHPQGAIPAWLAYPANYRLRQHYDKNGRPQIGARKDNPRTLPKVRRVAANRATPREVAAAVRLHTEYNDRAPRGSRRLALKPLPKAGVVLGKLIQVGYVSTRDGKRYLHPFRARSRPLLVASHDGTQALIVGGRFAITGRGIEDR